MKRLIVGIGLACAVALAGCAGGQPVKLVDNAAAQRAVFDAEGKYRTALIAAEAYVKLPLCTASKPPCASLPVVRAIQRAQPIARQAIDAAEQVVRTPGFGEEAVSSAITAATAAIGAFAALR